MSRVHGCDKVADVHRVEGPSEDAEPPGFAHAAQRSDHFQTGLRSRLSARTRAREGNAGGSPTLVA